MPSAPFTQTPKQLSDDNVFLSIQTQAKSELAATNERLCVCYLSPGLSISSYSHLFLIYK